MLLYLIGLYGPDNGLDNSTFLRCTTEGCHSVVCPACCGVCPDRLVCQDLQCTVSKEGQKRRVNADRSYRNVSLIHGRSATGMSISD